jgi:hypothetical protein
MKTEEKIASAKSEWTQENQDLCILCGTRVGDALRSVSQLVNTPQEKFALASFALMHISGAAAGFYAEMTGADPSMVDLRSVVDAVVCATFDAKERG